jgi:hypothetical protein
MSNKITLDPSIAVKLDINSVGLNELVVILFTANENWVGEFEFSVFNSSAKNTVVKPTEALVVEEKIMTLRLEPSTQGLTANMHYYEIVSLDTKRVIFKGLLNVTK